MRGVDLTCGVAAVPLWVYTAWQHPSGLQSPPKVNQKFVPLGVSVAGGSSHIRADVSHASGLADSWGPAAAAAVPAAHDHIGTSSFVSERTAFSQQADYSRSSLRPPVRLARKVSRVHAACLRSYGVRSHRPDAAAYRAAYRAEPTPRELYRKRW